MVSREKINSLAIVCVAAAASLLTASAIYRLHRRRRFDSGRRRCSEFDEKPQNRFKRVLADNSYSPFKHYKRESKEKEISLKVHPYEEEITSLVENPPTPIESVSNREQLAMDDSYLWIDKEEQLEMLANLLSIDLLL